jgi:dephospho-CoA kinase
MQIIIVVGMPATGKNIARDYATAKGYAYYATGDVVRAEVARRGLELNAQNTAAVSTELRGSDGMGVTRLALKTALQQTTSSVFLEGMRSWPEIELIRAQCPATVIAFLAPRETRRARIISRGRADDAPDAFDNRDKREIDYGTAIPIALADAYVLNTGTMEDAMRQLDAIIAALKN